jgi:hypothetical protein
MDQQHQCASQGGRGEGGKGLVRILLCAKKVEN